MPGKRLVTKVSLGDESKKSERARECVCIEYSPFSLNPCPGDLDVDLVRLVHRCSMKVACFNSRRILNDYIILSVDLFSA